MSQPRRPSASLGRHRRPEGDGGRRRGCFPEYFCPKPTNRREFENGLGLRAYFRDPNYLR